LVEGDAQRADALVAALPLSAGADGTLVEAPDLERVGGPVLLGLRVRHEVKEVVDGRVDLRVDVEPCWHPALRYFDSADYRSCAETVRGVTKRDPAGSVG